MSWIFFRKVGVMSKHFLSTTVNGVFLLQLLSHLTKFKLIKTVLLQNVNIVGMTTLGMPIRDYQKLSKAQG